MYFLYLYEFGTLKLVKIILRRERGKEGTKEGMNQTGVDCTHIWKCYNETPLQLLYTNKMIKN
jgi:hypothetical protein